MKSPTISKTVNSSHYLFKEAKNLPQICIFENISYQTVIYKTELLKENPIEIEKYGKFFDWPYLVKLSKLGNSILFDDPGLFYTRVHKTNGAMIQNLHLR